MILDWPFAMILRMERAAYASFPDLDISRTPEHEERRRRVLRRRHGGIAASATLAMLLGTPSAQPRSAPVTLSRPTVACARVVPERVLVTAESLEGEGLTNVTRLFRLLADLTSPDEPRPA